MIAPDPEGLRKRFGPAFADALSRALGEAISMDVDDEMVVVTEEPSEDRIYIWLGFWGWLMIQRCEINEDEVDVFENSRWRGGYTH